MDAQVAAKQPGDPRRLGPYELVGRLGQGGMGVVFLGRERGTGRLAAVKALRPELAGDPAFAARFRREVDAARRIDSPHVARVLDADPSADRPWLATEYVEGTTLATEVAATGPLNGERLLEFATGVAQALTTIHTAGVVHRDLKPTNVLLQQARGSQGPAITIQGERSRPARGARAAVQSPPGGEPLAGPDRFGVKVIDFGIAWAADATMTRSGLRFGTPSWMAPEQLRDQPAGPPTDVFAWGALVAFAATGRHPFGGGPADAVAYRILHDQPDLDGVPEAMRQLVRDALSRDPAARPTADRVVTILAAASPPTLPLPASDPTWVLLPAAGAGSDGSLPLGIPAGMAAGPTRRRRRRRVGRLLVAAALLAGLVTAPHVVLAAVEGPQGSSSQHRHTSKQCPGDEEDGSAAEDDRDHEPDDKDEENEEAEEKDEDEDEEEMAKDREPRTAGSQIGLGWPPAATPQPPSLPQQPPPTQRPPAEQPPSTHEPTGDPGSGSGNEVVGS